MGLNLKESGLLDEPASCRGADSSLRAHRPARRPVIVTMPAACKVELPEQPTIGPATGSFEKFAPPPAPAESLADDSVTPAAVEPQALLPQDREPPPTATPHVDSRLEKVVAAWPILPPTVQSTILALVRASVGK
jgi:hypothetical protein